MDTWFVSFVVRVRNTPKHFLLECLKSDLSQTSYSLEGESKPFGKRKDIVFIGGFGHKPHVDAVEYFINNIFPLIRRKIPEVKSYVLGSNIPNKLAKLCQETKNCILIGYVDPWEKYSKNMKDFAEAHYSREISREIFKTIFKTILEK